MPSRGKKYIDATRRFDRARVHGPAEALGLVKSLSSRNFDETVEAAFRLGVDPRKVDQMLRGAVSLPNGTGKSVRVAVFAQGPAAQEAQDAGADVVGADDLVDRIQYRTDRYGNVHMPIGKSSFTQKALIENYGAVLDEILRAKPAASKGR